MVAIPAGSKAEEAGLMPGDRLEVPDESLWIGVVLGSEPDHAGVWLVDG